MEREEQIINIMNRIKENNPTEAFKKVLGLDSGMRFILMYLMNSKGDVYASTISEKMCISRARVGILLKKMELKGYITKSISAKDGRIEVVNITSHGLQKCEAISAQIVKDIDKLISEVGYDKLNLFLDIGYRIKSVIEGE